MPLTPLHPGSPQMGEHASDLSPAAVSLTVSDRDRLLALRRTGLLDSRAEAAFDRLTRRATELIGAPASMVSLVDADRQFFKSARGLPEPAASARETPLSHSFCRYVVAGKRPLIVVDARLVPLLAEHPAIDDLRIVAYAGVPLRGYGHVLGAFCVTDAVPHVWSAKDVAVLEDLAGACETEIHLRGALRERRRREGEARVRALGDSPPGRLRGETHGLLGVAVTDASHPAPGGRRWLRPDVALPADAVL